MCAEYGGPAREYARNGVEQLRLPTLDTTQPSARDLVAGVRWIQARLRAQPGARVLVHCKGGRGRASTMALAFQLAREMEAASPSSPRGRAAPRRLMAAMKEKRPVVETAVARYPAVATFRKLWAEELQRRPGGASPGGGRLRTRRSHDNDGDK